MSAEQPPKPISPATPGIAPVRRFTLRLVDGRFVRIPQPESITGTSDFRTINPARPEVRDLFKLENGRFVRKSQPELKTAAASVPRSPAPAAPPPPPSPAEETPQPPSFSLTSLRISLGLPGEP